MEEDHEVLDWGNEEDEHHQEPLRTPSFVEDADDAVSLGDEEEDNTFYSCQVQENGSSSFPSTVRVAESDPTNSLGSDHFQDLDVDEASPSQQGFPQDEAQTSSTTQADASAQNNSSKRAQNLLKPRLTHALPPKPVAASLPYLPPSHPSIVEATAMSARTREYKRISGSGSGSADKPPSHHKDQLPPDWEIRYPRGGGRTAYYYNTVTHQSTWHHPAQPPPSNKTKSGGSSGKPPLIDSYVPQPLTYEDRHYRPDEQPDLRRDGRTNDEPELRRPVTPPTRSPPRERPHSCSPPAPPREILTESQDRNRSRRSNHDADLKGDSFHQPRNDGLPVSGTSASCQIALNSQNESGGHSNREIYNQQVVPANLTDLSLPVNEDGLPLSIRGHGYERVEHDLPHGTLEGRQGPNHSLSLSSSRSRSPSAPHDREWIPARREQRGTEPTQNTSIKPETSRPAAASRRDRPSRFDQPSAFQTSPTVTPSTLAEQTTSRPVYIPADLQAPHELPASDSNPIKPPEPSPFEDSRNLHAGDNWSSPDNRPNRQALPTDAERALPISDQSGPPSRRKRVPLPPQADSFREETSRRKDHDGSRTGISRPGAVPFPTLLQEHQTDACGTGTSPRGTPQSVPHSRVESHVEHRHRVSSNDGQNESNITRRGNLTIDNEHSARGYPQTRAHRSIDASMDIDVDRMPPSSRVPSNLPSRAQDDDTSRPTKAVLSRSSGAGTNPSTEASNRYSIGDSRREGSRDEILERRSPPPRLDHPSRNERIIHERPDRHGSRKESRGRSTEHKAALSGSVPKLTGPNSVPVGTRRPTAFNSDLSPPVPEYGSGHKFSAEQPPRPPSITPGKESYDRPSYDIRSPIDNFSAGQRDYTEPGQLRQTTSSSSYKRDVQPEPINATVREGRPDHQPRERSLFRHPVREDRVPRTYDNESQSRTRSSSAERRSTRNRPPAQWQQPETRIPAQLPPLEFLSGKGIPPRNLDDDRHYRPGKQDHYREQTDAYMSSSADDLTSRSRRPDIHTTIYGSRSAGLPQPPSPNQGGPNDRSYYPSPRQQRPPERSRPVENLTSNTTTTSSERRSRWGDSHPASGVPDSPDHRPLRRLSVVDRYEPDYGDGFSGAPQRRRPRSAKEDSQQVELNHRGDMPYIPSPHHDHDVGRPSARPLLDRLSLDTPHPPMNDPILQDRVTIPGKRDRNTVDRDYPVDSSFEEAGMGEPEVGEPVAKKVRRRGHRQRRGRRGNGAP